VGAFIRDTTGPGTSILSVTTTRGNEHGGDCWQVGFKKPRERADFRLREAPNDNCHECRPAPTINPASVRTPAFPCAAEVIFNSGDSRAKFSSTLDRASTATWHRKGWPWSIGITLSTRTGVPSGVR
jgi:hypothetical protein